MDESAFIKTMGDLNKILIEILKEKNEPIYFSWMIFFI